MIETERLILQEMRIEDIDALFDVYTVFEGFTKEKMQKLIEWHLKNYKEYGHGLWAMVLKEKGEVIGDCGIVVQPVEGKQELEIGYHVRRDLWGNGYATEAAIACWDWGFQHLNCQRLISLIPPDNRASRRVAEKNGMIFIKEFIWEKNNKPTCLYAVERIIDNSSSS